MGLLLIRSGAAVPVEDGDAGVLRKFIHLWQSGSTISATDATYSVIKSKKFGVASTKGTRLEFELLEWCVLRVHQNYLLFGGPGGGRTHV